MDSNGSVIIKTLSFLEKNIFSFTTGIMCLIHLTLLVIFTVAGIMPLMMFNILSVVVYLFCFLLCKTGQLLPVYVSIILEVTIYSVISTYFAGLDAASYCFLFAIVPIIILIGCNLFKGSRRWGIVAMLVLNFAVYVAMYIRFNGDSPIFEMSPALKGILVVFSTFVMVFSMIFYTTVFIFNSEREMLTLEKKNQRLSADAREDPLTNLYNRRGFLPLVNNLMRSDPFGHFCIAFCDLDDFKCINDTYGHEAGDEVLKQTTNIIRKELPGSDICRWGGEEFVILIRDCTLEEARDKAEGLRKSIESNPIFFFDHKLFITTTIGLEENKDTYTDPEQIIKTADERMYYGKQHGKNILISEDL